MEQEIIINVLDKNLTEFDGSNENPKEENLKIALSSFLAEMQTSHPIEEFIGCASSFFAELSRKDFNYFVLQIPLEHFFTDEDEVYNEANLVSLRKIVQQADSSTGIGGFAFCDSIPILIQPTYQTGKYSFDEITACLKHIARRLKKEKAICGFIFNRETTSELEKKEARQAFANELLEKHPQYKFYLV